MLGRRYLRLAVKAIQDALESIPFGDFDAAPLPLLVSRRVVGLVGEVAGDLAGEGSARIKQWRKKMVVSKREAYRGDYYCKSITNN